MKRLMDLLAGQRYEKEFKIGETKIVLQTLWKQEELEVIKKVQGLDYLGQIEESKIPILARSIVKVDDIPIAAYTEIQEELRKNSNLTLADAVENYLKTFDGGAIDVLYSCYLELKKERDSLKGKLLGFTQPPKEGGFTNSVSSSE